MALKQYVYIYNVIVLIQWVHLVSVRFLKESEDLKK
jgi:hypothetical protein